MSITLTGNQTSFSIIWDEVTIILVVGLICVAWAISSYNKYRSK